MTDYAPGAAPRTAQEAAPERPRIRPRPEAAARSVSTEPSLGNRQALADPRSLRTAVFVVLGVLLLALIAWGLVPTEHDGRVAEKTWERTISLEVLDTDVEQGSSVPTGGRELRSERKIRTYRDILDHYVTRTRQVTDRVPSGTEPYSCGTRDLGNGYFEDKTCTRTTYRRVTRQESYQEAVYRKEPVWDIWRTYEEDEWEYDRTLTAQGSDSAPVWPELPVLGPREREGTRTETYVAAFDTAEGERTGATLSFEDWSGLEVGDLVRWSASPPGRRQADPCRMT